MKINIIIPVLAVLCTASAYAKCENSKTLFSCITTKGKQIEVCDAEKTIDYSFGKPQGKPEVVVKAPREQASTFQWDGMGRSISYAVDIPNKDTTYNVFWGADRLSENQAVEAGVNVFVNKKLVATVLCTDKNIVNNLEGVKLKPTE
jgi:hypothetical protein